jgi:hypothetical protein
MKIKYLILFLFLMQLKSFSQNSFIGPMIHYNFGAEKNHFSWGIEASYWPKDIIMGVDCGFEFEKGKKRLYLEYEVGAIAGVAFGYVREFYKNKDSKGGGQISVWGAVFGGVDFRLRKIIDEVYIAPGVFAKYPINITNTSNIIE